MEIVWISTETVRISMEIVRISTISTAQIENKQYVGVWLKFNVLDDRAFVGLTTFRVQRPSSAEKSIHCPPSMYKHTSVIIPYSLTVMRSKRSDACQETMRRPLLTLPTK